ncbi:Co-chaperone protein DjlA [Dissostichus eleginoides]|uniref:Co-chaperone protein DjlA n=1 Tax=Dissostichus eleginoides TaxID=100907 RepID=A0AAD9BWS2_DISEL|nr:Co-chaperone protein DjlA [Dissostichus eleginoides]
MSITSETLINDFKNKEEIKKALKKHLLTTDPDRLIQGSVTRETLEESQDESQDLEMFQVIACSLLRSGGQEPVGPPC